MAPAGRRPRLLRASKGVLVSSISSYSVCGACSLTCFETVVVINPPPPRYPGEKVLPHSPQNEKILLFQFDGPF